MPRNTNVNMSVSICYKASCRRATCLRDARTKAPQQFDPHSDRKFKACYARIAHNAVDIGPHLGVLAASVLNVRAKRPKRL